MQSKSPLASHRGYGLSTGVSKGEILNLQWKDVDLQTGRVVLHKTKNGERRVAFIKFHALELLKQHAGRFALKSRFVFPNTSNTAPSDIKEAWNRALERSGIEDFKFHDLRHTAASYLAMNGATPSEIAEVLGHKTLVMVKRYAHLSENHTQKVIASMNEAVFG